ncbi:hypothetical protein DPMN_176604 [Dreissena polymorpha]|uniref:Uncharacterized protein n=1 Tax=Dreissena polymorpha TaxID=45954 RepID=A0A9D4II82_DREPO|nr:hypothetical protein DPMN_176604 [Dreissena polymorpha]
MHDLLTAPESDSQAPDVAASQDDASGTQRETPRDRETEHRVQLYIASARSVHAR